ncbi:MAG: Protein-O-mannosyltransferase [uncultured Propionibacteriaceae bacterium]|uniref:Polyprenol-phosphate-mannose--protein mannosyltransferase n=1 Tax=uncultured Propionibacteriaceae bacterium TaxID=257457 RepID=A0A6J4P322_9ACTN|nr:MAG: Protein-O-mannosyltransferase [uncultured Propionibacteriaceae bacterium]
MIREVLEVGAPSRQPTSILDRESDAQVGSAATVVHPRSPDTVLSTVDRLRVPMPSDRLTGWLVTVVITAIAFVIRLVNLGHPQKLVFDETYYAKDAYSLLTFGYEKAWPDSANKSILAGTPDVMNDNAAFIVHPQVGKWLIAGGEYLFGMNSFGWRFASLVFGSLLVLVTIRLVRRVSRSTLIGGLAGLLLTFDGLTFVMSRIALLDIFLAFFLVCAVACLAADRDWFRSRLAGHLERSRRADLGGRFGPALVVRPWRLAAGLCFGLALGTKWNALYVLAAFALLSLAWDIGARRMAGAGNRAYWGVLRDGLPAFVSLVVLSAVVYVASWASWLGTSGGWDRDWGANHPEATSVKLFGSSLGSLIHYNKAIWDFHTGDFINDATHAYDAHPAGWLILARPIGIDAVNDIKPGTAGCSGPENCLQVISGIGTPVLWWAAIIALVAAAVLWVGGRDWRFGIPVVGVLSAWLPWFAYTDRPLFFFYAITIIPFSVMAVALCVGRLLGPSEGGNRRLVGAVAAGVFVALVGANFAYLYPVLTDQVLPRSEWLSRMWFRTWI